MDFYVYWEEIDFNNCACVEEIMLLSQDFTIENFSKHVDNINSSNSNSERMISLKWLENFQDREEAWSVCYGALTGSFQESLQHYAILILKNKITNLAQTFTDVQIKEIYNFFINFLKIKKPHIRITNEICVALAHMCIKNSNWKEPLHLTISDMARLESKSATNASLNPEEFTPEAAVLFFLHEYFFIIKRTANNRQRIILADISSNWEMLISTINYLFSIYTNPELCRDFSYLIKLIFVFRKLHIFFKLRNSELFESPIFQTIIHFTQIHYSEVDLIKACSQCICSFLNRLDSKFLFTNDYYIFFINFVKSLHQNIEKAISCFNIAYLTGILDLVTILSDRYFIFYLTTDLETDFTFINYGFMICSINNYKLLISFLHFWANFQDIGDKFNNLNKYLSFCHKYCDMLVKLILKVLPISDEITDDTYDEENDIEYLRETVLEVFKGILRYVKCDQYFNDILSLFSQGNKTSFSLLEASIILARGMIIHKPELEYEKILRYICLLPIESPHQLLKTSCLFIEQLISYYSRPMRKKYSFVIDFLYRCIRRPSVQIFAADTLCLCVSSGIDNYDSPEILEAINNIILKTADSRISESLIVLFAIKFSKCEIQNKENVLMNICMSHFKEAIKIIENKVSFSNINQFESLETLGTFFKELNDNFHDVRTPFFPIVDHLTDVTLGIIDYVYTNEPTCEKACRLMKHLYKFAGTSYSNYEKVSEKQIEYFKKYGYSGFVYNFYSIYNTLSEQKNHHEWLDKHFHFLLDIIFNKFHNNSPRDNPFLVEDFMRLCRRAFAVDEFKILLLPSIERIITIASIGLSSSQYSTFKASHSFIFNVFNPDLFKKSKESHMVKSALINLFEKKLSGLIRNSINVIFSKSTLNYIETCGSLLHRIILFERNYSTNQQLKSTQIITEECRRYITEENYVIVYTFIEKMITCKNFREAGNLAETLSKDLFGN